MEVEGIYRIFLDFFMQAEWASNEAHKRRSFTFLIVTLKLLAMEA